MGTHLNNQPRHQVLKEKLLSEIASLGPGAKLYTVKSMMKRYSVSQATVDRALRGLKEDGLIESRVGIGTYVSHAQKQDRALVCVDLFVFGTQKMIDNPGFHHDLISGLGRELGQEGRSLRTSIFPRSTDLASVTETVDKLSPDAVVAMYVNDPGVGSMLAGRRIPYVQLVPYWPVDLPNSFVLDNRQIASDWVRHLTGHGHSRIAYLHGVLEKEYNRDMNERLQFFYEEMARAGVVPDPDILIYGGFSREEGYDGAKRLLATGKPFTAVVVNDHAAAGVYDAFREAGIEIGKDISVVGTDDLSWAAHMHPALTTVRISRAELAHRAVVELEKIIEGRSSGFEKQYIPSKLIERDSVNAIA